MKTMINMKMWHELESVLASLNIGYKIDFDDHNGINEMLIKVDPVGILRTDDERWE